MSATEVGGTANPKGGSDPMNLEALGNAGDFIGGLGVIVTLLYLAIQIRHNTATTRVQTVQHLLTTNSESINSIVAGPVPAVLAKIESGEEISEEERVIYRIFLRGRLTEQLQIFYQLQNEMIEEEIAEALQERLAVFTQPDLFREMWKGPLRLGFPRAFRDHVDRQLAEQP